MQDRLPPLRLTGAMTLRDGVMQQRTVAVADGRIAAGPFPAIDLTGYYVLPGIIDLHGDAFERHIAPRPTAPFPALTGLRGADRDAAANGVTTAWLAQSWSWEGGMRSPEFAEVLMKTLDDYRPEAMTDLRIQIRYETHEHGSADRLLAAVRRHAIDYVIFNNHLDEAVKMATLNPANLSDWASKSGRTSAELLEVVTKAKQLSKEVPRRLAGLADAFDVLGVRYGSHDDPEAETREFYSMIGAKICEFPLTQEAAAVARAVGDPVLMGAPNVVRGGSQSGNIAAIGLIRRGLCDALVSDYFYPALSQAAFRLVDDGILDLPAAWALISRNPARIIGLPDRGVIELNRRADLTIVNQQTKVVEGTISNGRLTYLGGAAAARFMGRSVVAERVPERVAEQVAAE